MSATTTFRWRTTQLEVVEDCASGPVELLAADSWLVDAGRTLALDLHRARFLAAATDRGIDATELEAFWASAIAAIPATGAWFPRVEARRTRDVRELRLLLREAPERHRSLTVSTHPGRDPRTRPRVKGPDLEAMLRLRTEAQSRGADEAVLLTAEGHIVEGSTTCLAWWRGDAIAVPSPALDRIDSVTLRSVLALATALGVDVLHEHARPADLDGLEVWALNALHGIRIVTAWEDVPQLAEQPGRLRQWRERLDALRRPVHEGRA
ncbi:aminotransferase class IV [uncultured Schumannella sp.]|uniref:aminotransferase class IV n=1 Tax=uncultured Schumannella sp. TaxID=1195956 RepID=UPI0025D4C20F|nr:aminotransferase class IV [uncultured Schumannella sp.]